MERINDLVDCLGNDLGLAIMGLLDEPIDVVRAAAVSQSWRRFVIANGLCKKIFLKRFPHVGHIAYENEGFHRFITLSNISTVDAADWADLERDHRIYSSLLEPLAAPMDLHRDCLSYPLASSSARSILDTALHINDHDIIYVGGHLFWSSEGQADPGVPEYITYKLSSDVCIVAGVNIRPYGASSEPGNPIYSPTSVRFRFGYSRPLTDSELESSPVEAFDLFTWTYTSAEFPVTQEARVQEFKLPTPIVCIGGVIQIEMLGRAQMSPSDGLFYIHLRDVEVAGQSLYPAYILDVLKNGELQLECHPHALHHVLRNFRLDPEEQAHLRQDIELVLYEEVDRDEMLFEEEARFIDELFEEAERASST